MLITWANNNKVLYERSRLLKKKPFQHVIELAKNRILFVNKWYYR